MVHVIVGTANALGGIITPPAPTCRCSSRRAGRRSPRQGCRARATCTSTGPRRRFDQVRSRASSSSGTTSSGSAPSSKTVVDRALAIARSEPAGPVYLTLPREVLAERLDEFEYSARRVWSTAAPPSPRRRPWRRRRGSSPRPGARSSSPRPPAAIRRPYDRSWRWPRRSACRLRPVAHLRKLPARPPAACGLRSRAVPRRRGRRRRLESDVPWFPAVGRRGPRRRSSKSATTRSSPATRSAASRWTWRSRGCRASRSWRSPRRAAAADAAVRGRPPPALGGRAPAAARGRGRRAPERFGRRGRSTWRGSHAASATSRNERSLVATNTTSIRRRSVGGRRQLLRLVAGVGARLGARGRGRRQARRARQDRHLLRRRRRVLLRGAGVDPLGRPRPGPAVLFVVFNNGAWNAVKQSVRHHAPDGWAVRTESMPLTALEPALDYELICARPAATASASRTPPSFPRPSGAPSGRCRTRSARRS